MDIRLTKNWKESLDSEFRKPYFSTLVEFVKEEYRSHTVYPSGTDIFRALDQSDFKDIKVVVIGQDPYHGPGQANGLSFSVGEGVKIPPSLQNIFKEVKTDIGVTPSNSGNLERWAKQGVLLLNATLTVRHKSPGSHQKKGWEQFTDAIVSLLNSKRENLVFILWGKYAQQKGTVIDSSKHFIIRSPHPSPFSAHTGFFGSKPFSKTNEYLKQKNIEEINW